MYTWSITYSLYTVIVLVNRRTIGIQTCTFVKFSQKYMGEFGIP